MSLPTEDVTSSYKPNSSTSDGTLHKVPTLSEYEGIESFVYVSSKRVLGIFPDTITVGREFPGSKEVKGTTIMTAGDSIFVPMTPADVAVLLNLELVG